MFKRYLGAVVLGGLVALPACTSNQAAVEPSITVADVTQDRLQFQVGTANINGTPGLNVVTTFRQPSGFSAVLVSTPTITLPFTNTASAAQAGIDAGTNHITGTPQQLAGVAGPSTTFGQMVGAFSYGFLASNSTQTGANTSTFYSVPAGTGSASGSNAMPYYAPNPPPSPPAPAGLTSRNAFYVGPPFLPNFKDGSLGTAFLGASSGFTVFQITPTTGAYGLSLVLPGLSQSVPTFTSSTSLANTTLMPVMPTPTWTSDNAGGGTVTVNIPAGVAETMIELHSTAGNAFYTFVTHATGLQTFQLADNLGTITNGVAGPSIAFSKPAVGSTPAVVGDTLKLFAVGFDYPALEAVEFGNGPFPQTPTINNIGAACTFSGVTSTCTGQADITMSNPLTPPIQN